MTSYDMDHIFRLYDRTIDHRFSKTFCHSINALIIIHFKGFSRFLQKFRTSCMTSYLPTARKDFWIEKLHIALNSPHGDLSNDINIFKNDQQ